MRVLVTGGCGYKGSVLVPKLLEAGYKVIVLDTEWFGNYLEPNPNLSFWHQDLRDISSYADGLNKVEAIIHLAGIANDPCGELDSKLTWEVNALGTMRLADAASRRGVSQFIFSSSASIYGLKGNRPVVENDEPEPVSDYNKTKMVAERALLSYQNQMAVQIVRPATVCGLSPRMRLDTMVNMLTHQALSKGKITAHCGEHGGGLMRPNIHIQDVTDLYIWLLKRPKIVGCWNAGFENISAMDTAKMISDEVKAEIEITTVKDKRSYAVDSSMLLDLGFKPRCTVRQAIREIREAYKIGDLQADDRSVNLVWMRKLGIAS